MTTDKRRDCIMETITCGHDYTTSSIHRHHRQHQHHGTNLNLENNSIQNFDNTTSSYFLNSKTTDPLMVNTSSSLHMNKNYYHESTTSDVLMNVEENSQHADSAIHTLISNNNNDNTNVHTIDSPNEDADVTMCICPVCGFSASSPRRQDEHMELVHGDVNVSHLMTTTSHLTSSLTPPTSSLSSSTSTSTTTLPTPTPTPTQTINHEEEEPQQQMNHSTISFDFFQSNQRSLLQLQASSTPQRVKFCSTHINEPIHSSLNTTTINEQIIMNTNLKNPVNSCFVIDTTTSLNETIDKYGVGNMNNTCMNAVTGGAMTAITTTTSTTTTNSSPPSSASASSTSSLSSASSTEIQSKFKTSHLPNDMNQLKITEKSRQHTSASLSLKNGKSKEKHKCFTSSTLSTSSSISSPSSLLPTSIIPSSITVTTITTATDTNTTTKTTGAVIKGDGDDDDHRLHHQPQQQQSTVKKVDSRRRYRCNICPTTFPWHGDLTEHLRSVHGMQKSRENARNGKAGSFCCSHCKYVAKYQSELNRHMRLHWGVKPFICVFCPYRSAWKGDLKRHMESHHRERFTCETELIKIMSQFKNNAGTRLLSSSASSSSSLLASSTTFTGTCGHRPILPMSQFDITTESSEGDNVSDRYNCLQIDEDDVDDDEDDVMINPGTSITTTTTNNNNSNTNNNNSHSFNVAIENADNNSNENDHPINSIMMKSFPIELTSLTTNNKNSSIISNHAKLTDTSLNNMMSNYFTQTTATTNDNINNLICNICSYHAQNQSKFKNHMASHINLKQFKCPICGQRSNYKWDITKHLKKQHPNCNQLPITIINNTVETIDENHVNASTALMPISLTMYSSSSSSSASASASALSPSIISPPCSSQFPVCALSNQSSLVSCIPTTEQLALLTRPQTTPTSLTTSATTTQSTMIISPKSNEISSLDMMTCKNYLKFPEISMNSNEMSQSNDSLNLIGYSSINQFTSSPLQNSFTINNSNNNSNNNIDLSMNDSLPIDLSTGYSQKHIKQDDIKNPMLLLTNPCTQSQSSGLSVKSSLENNQHQNYPISSIDINNTIYSTATTMTTSTAVTSPCLTSSNSISTITLSDIPIHYPILSNIQRNITHSFMPSTTTTTTSFTTTNSNNTTHHNNSSLISPYTIGSFISTDPLKPNSSPNSAINLLFNIQQQVLMTGLLQTWQQQQQQQQSSQKYHELQQRQLQFKDLSMHRDTYGTVSYSDVIINMTSPITSCSPSNLSRSSHNNNSNSNVTQITRTTTTTPITSHGTLTSNINNSAATAATVVAVNDTVNTSYHTMFKSLVNNHLPELIPSIVITSSSSSSSLQSQIEKHSSIDLTNKTNQLNDHHQLSPINWESKKSTTSDWSITSTCAESLKQLSNTVPADENQQQKNQLQVNRFFTPGRRKESQRLLTRTNNNNINNNGRKSAPNSSLFNCHVDVNNPAGTIGNLNSSNSSNNNNKEEQWKRFQCSGCGHRSNWKWDINKHIKVSFFYAFYMCNNKLSKPHTIIDCSQNEKIELKRELGLWSAVSITIGTIIGSGVFVTPKGVLENSEQSPGISVIIWILCGFISLLGSLCYAELGTTITHSGGDYVYIKQAFGNLPAFLQLWVNLVIIRPTSTAICAFSFAYYALYPIYSYCDPPHLLILSFSILSITFLTWINIMKVRWATRIQNIFTAAKLLALVGIILSGLYVACQGRIENFNDFWQPVRSIHPSRMALAFYSGLFAYAGWNFLNIITEEIQNPEQNLPRSIYISITIVTVVYVLTNMAYFIVLQPYEIIQSNAVAVTFAAHLYGQFSWIMSIFISLSCFGGLNGILFTSGRLNFVAAREGQLPALLATIHVERLTPVPAILLNCCLSLIMLVIPDLFTLINYVSFVQWLSVGASILAMLYLRHSQPDLPRPIRLPLIIPITFLIVCGFLLIFPVFHKPKELFTGIIMVLSGIPIYLIGITWNRKSGIFLQKYHYITIQCQKLMHVIYPE
ncbi:unnamed protein product [Schistosoma turkestanicum]|nr:unnamed protein product [Schistosoma turkestanicum]